MDKDGGILLWCALILYFDTCLQHHKMYIRNLFFSATDPDIDPSWYTGRGIRPVGRFGRRGTAWEDAQKSLYRQLGQACIPIEESTELSEEN
uniref:Prolactin-releasing peptide n=1 Tax=Xenopus tropicalis TaxID=8364 RepID=A0A6I8SI08_XENTR